MRMHIAADSELCIMACDPILYEAQRYEEQLQADETHTAGHSTWSVFWQISCVQIYLPKNVHTAATEM